MQNQPLITLTDVSVVYNPGKPNEIRALDSVNASIFPNEYVVLFGPSGCGKSTLLYVISGLQKATSGNVNIFGQSLQEMNEEGILWLHRVGVGMIFQSFHLLPSLSVIDNVCLPQTLMGIPTSRRRDSGNVLLKRFGMIRHAKKSPNELSGGEKQRVAIARSIINNPDIILADEPVGNLDTAAAQNVMQILKELNETDKKTVLVVTHDPAHLYFADRVLYMNDGKIIREEVRKEKRPVDFVYKNRDLLLDRLTLPNAALAQEESVSPELRLLMQTFKGLSEDQLGILLIPYKAKQLINHVLSALTFEQIQSAETIVKNFLMRQSREAVYNEGLDFSGGEVSIDKRRSDRMVQRMVSIFRQSRIIGHQEDVQSIVGHLKNFFELELSDVQEERLSAAIRERLKCSIGKDALCELLDRAVALGGVGLYRGTVNKIVQECEIIMLMKFSGEAS